MHLARRIACLAVVTMLLTACQTQGMQWRRDDAVTITSPSLRERVSLPVTLQWEPSEELQAVIDSDPGAILYGVFVDRAPIATGAELADVVNRNCERPGGCVDAQSLADRGIHVTSLPQLVLDDLDDLRQRGDVEGQDIHEVTIVVLRRPEDEAATGINGARTDEFSYRIEFVVDREAQA